MTELRIPAAGDAVTEVQLVEWVVANGVTVSAGQHIYSIESDKSVLEVEAPVDGVLRIAVEAGGILPVGELVGAID